MRLINLANKQPRYKAAYKITTYQVEILNRMKDKLLKVDYSFESENASCMIISHKLCKAEIYAVSG